MSDHIGPFFADPSISSSPTTTLIDREVHQLLIQAYHSAYTLLYKHRNQLIALAETLLQHEQLDRIQFELHTLSHTN